MYWYPIGMIFKASKFYSSKSHVLMSFFVIVIGASAGGQDAVCKLLASFPLKLNAAIFIVLHLSKDGLYSLLTKRLQKCTSLPCVLATNELTIEQGHVYVAPVDQHLILKQDVMYLSKGPAENRWRPSIDVLFRSAAVYYSGQVIGIILTGLLYDGTAGMQAIKKCGGACMVQDPREAAYPSMPQSVIDNTIVDYILPVAEMEVAIQQIILNKPVTEVAIPAEIIAETALIEKTSTSILEVSKLGKQTVYSCPDCGGGLWEIKEGDHIRYRCHIGHAYSEGDLLIQQHESLSATLWVALRMMEERKNLLIKISLDEKMKNMQSLAEMHVADAKELEVHINNLKELLFNVKPD
jgi:two-component system chemotaxis response regulator CheB